MTADFNIDILLLLVYALAHRSSFVPYPRPSMFVSSPPAQPKTAAPSSIHGTATGRSFLIHQTCLHLSAQKCRNGTSRCKLGLAYLYAPTYKKDSEDNGIHVVVSIRALGPHTRQSTMRYRVTVRVMPSLYIRFYIRIRQVDTRNIHTN